jgi:uncharacterized membrane protein
MTLLLFLLGLFLLAIPIIAVAALVKAVGLAEQLQRLEARLAALERGPPAAAPEASLSPPPAAVAPPPAAEPIAERVAEHTAAASEPAAPAPAIPASLAPPGPPLPSAPSKMGFEERFGTQWAVWIGGIALALGGIFLVRYSIEQGLLGPGMRVMLGGLLATALVGAGEWTRRTEKLSAIASLPAAHIPSILTAAGTTVAFADVYAAYKLYALLTPAAAFVLLGAVALATLAAALLHGPALAGLGLVGAFLTPALVATDKPDYWALYLYLAVVSAAAFALARARLWRWLALSAVLLAFLWTFAGVDAASVEALDAHLFHVIAGFLLVACLIVAGLLLGPDALPDRIDEVSSVALAAYLLAAAALVLTSQHEPIALLAFVMLLVATVAIAWRTPAATGAVPVAAVLAVLVVLHWVLNLDIEHLLAPSGPVAGAVPEPPQAELGWHLVVGAAIATLFGVSGFLIQLRSRAAPSGGAAHEAALIDVLWAASAVFTPTAILAALYYHIAGLEPSVPFAAIGLLLATLFALATETLVRRESSARPQAATAVFATGAVAALALAFTMALEKGWLTIALALTVPGVAWVADKRPLPGLRTLAALVGILVMVRIGLEPRIVGSDVGTTPIFNWLLYGYGIPAGAFWLGGHLLRRYGDDGPTRTIEAGAVLLTVLLAFLEIRHLVTGGDVYRASSSLTEVALQVAVGLAMTIGLERLRLHTGSVVHDIGALLIAALTLTAIVLGLGFVQNPLLTGTPVGGRFINLILLGYALPALLAAVLALVVRGARPSFYSTTAAVAAVGLALVYLSLEVRTFFHGEVLDSGATTDAEQYSYSAMWLVFGVVLLAAGVGLRSQAVRFASAAVVILTVLKVFLIDMQDLRGVYQALSFIGLGIVLIGIGWLYQRLLFPHPRLGAPGAPPSTGA